MKGILLLLPLVIFISCNSVPEREHIPISPEEAYTQIVSNLNPEYPGRGVDVFDERELDRPMAYGLIVSAESNRYKFTKDSSALEMARKAGDWLLKNSDINDNGIKGFGLADSFDAYSDDTTNPPHSEYTITTAIAVCGLLDWYSVEPDSLKKLNILKETKEILDPFLDNTNSSPLGIPAYSFHINDSEMDVYNPALFAAGQMKRISTILEDDSVSSLFGNKSKEIVDLCLSNQKVDDEGMAYWDYGIQIERPNDLVHACYIIEGYREYIEYDGKVDLSWELIIGHLNSFQNGGVWYEYYQRNLQKPKYNSRLWALGMLMYSLAKEEDFERIEHTLWSQIEEYHLGKGKFMLKTNDERRLLRHEAHLLLGLSYYLYH